MRFRDATPVRCPGADGTTVRSSLEGDGSRARAGLTVLKPTVAVAYWSAVLLFEQATAMGGNFVPAGSRYSLKESLGGGSPRR